MGNTCCGKASVQASSSGKRMSMKKNKVHALDSSLINRDHSDFARNEDIPTTPISEPPCSDLSTVESSLPNTACSTGVWEAEFDSQSEQPEIPETRDNNIAQVSMTNDACSVPMSDSHSSSATTVKTDSVHAGQARIYKVFAELQKTQDTLIPKPETKFDAYTVVSDKCKTQKVPSEELSENLDSCSESEVDNKETDGSENKNYEKLIDSEDNPPACKESSNHIEKTDESIDQYQNDFEDTADTNKFTNYTRQELREDFTNTDNEITVSDIEFEDEELPSVKSEDLSTPEKTETKPDTQNNITEYSYLSVDDTYLTKYSETEHETGLEKPSETEFTISEQISTEVLRNSISDTIKQLEDQGEDFSNSVPHTVDTLFSLLDNQLEGSRNTSPNTENAPINLQEEQDFKNSISDSEDTPVKLEEDQSEVTYSSSEDYVNSEPEQIPAWKIFIIKTSVQLMRWHNHKKLEQFMRDGIKPPLKIIERLRVEDADIERKIFNHLNKKYKFGTLENLQKKRHTTYSKMKAKKHREKCVSKEIEQHKVRMTHAPASEEYPRPASPALKVQRPSSTIAGNAVADQSEARGFHAPIPAQDNNVVDSKTGRRFTKCIDQTQVKKMMVNIAGQHLPTPPPPKMTMFDKLEIRHDVKDMAVAWQRNLQNSRNEGHCHQSTGATPCNIPRQTASYQIISFDNRKAKNNEKDLGIAQQKKVFDTTNSEQQCRSNNEATQCQGPPYIHRQTAGRQVFAKYTMKEQTKCPDAQYIHGQAAADQVAPLGAVMSGQTDETGSATNSSLDKQQYERRKIQPRTSNGLFPAINVTSTQHDAVTFFRRPASPVVNSTARPGEWTESRPVLLPVPKTVLSKPLYDTRNTVSRLQNINSGSDLPAVGTHNNSQNRPTNDTLPVKRQPFSFSTESSVLTNFGQSKPSARAATASPTLERTVNETQGPPRKARSTILPNIYDSNNMNSNEFDDMNDPQPIERQITYLHIQNQK